MKVTKDYIRGILSVCGCYTVGGSGSKTINPYLAFCMHKDNACVLYKLKYYFKLKDKIRIDKKYNRVKLNIYDIKTLIKISKISEEVLCGRRLKVFLNWRKILKRVKENGNEFTKTEYNKMQKYLPSYIK